MARFCVFLVAIGMTAPALAAPARAYQRDPVAEEAFGRELAAIDPALVPIFRDGTAALDAGQTKEALSAFQTIAARAPNHAATLRRLSYALRTLGDVPAAITMARRARLAGPGVDGDSALALTLVAKKGDSADDRAAMQEAGDLADHLLEGQPTEAGAATAAQVAVARNDLPALGRAVETLETVAPQSVAAGYFGAIYHVSRGDLHDADLAIGRAEAAGLPAAVAAEFRDGSGISRNRTLRQIAWAAGIGFALWMLGLAAIFLVGQAMSGRAMAAIERLAPERSDALVVSTGRFRRAYGAVIHFAAVYYFVSIPIVMLLVVGLGGAVLYGILMFGWIPIKLALLIGLGVLVSVSALVRSFFVRRGIDSDPGVRLNEQATPDLWAVLREVAAQVGTRPVDDVFLSPGTEIAVTERGTLAERVRDRGRRHLILGIGVLDGLTERQLRAVMAHEYGHFSHRDTARGDLARTVQASLLVTIVRLAQDGGASPFNPAWHFLRLFFLLFQRIALGANRLQEVLADRFAATVYGGPALATALQHIVRRTVEFNASTEAMINQAQVDRRALASLYVPPTKTTVSPVDVEKALAAAMSDAGSPYDSHPPVARRIAWLTAFGEATSVAAGVTSDGPAWDLFPDQNGIEARMTAIVNTRLADAGHIDTVVPQSVRSPLEMAAPTAAAAAGNQRP
ncbi:MAG: hypothetical protein QOI66_353 [Myxococcales bacterium]|nr:hypothetical protein [Myxococcales bacterium]